jgi:phospholipid-binding lipoprotein MlaA
VLKILPRAVGTALLFAFLMVAIPAAGAGTAADPTGTGKKVPGAPASEDAFYDEEFDDLDLNDLENEDPETGDLAVADPLIHFNRAMFTFNDRLYFWVLKPVAIGYKAVIPIEFRICVKNFFRNLAAPVRIVNSLLQGKPRAAGGALARFLINTTAGVAGLGDAASQFPGLETGDEDLGQTLGSYGVGSGIYLVWPIFGPSTLRDTVGMVGDRFLDPRTYVLSTSEAMGASGAAAVNGTSLRIGKYESLKAAALEPYEAFRDGYIQYRRKQIEE